MSSMGQILPLQALTGGNFGNTFGTYAPNLPGMDSGLLISFLALDLLLVCVPGADWAYAITAGLRDRSVTWAVGGLVAGYALHTLLAAAGLAVLVAGSPGLLTVLTVAGAAYLVWPGWSVLRRPGTPGAAAQDGPAARGGRLPGRVFLRGATISGLNPKGLLLYLSVLPQFLVTRGAPAGARADCRPGTAAHGVLCRRLPHGRCRRPCRPGRAPGARAARSPYVGRRDAGHRGVPVGAAAGES